MSDNVRNIGPGIALEGDLKLFFSDGGILLHKEYRSFAEENVKSGRVFIKIFGRVWSNGEGLFNGPHLGSIEFVSGRKSMCVFKSLEKGCFKDRLLGPQFMEIVVKRLGEFMNEEMKEAPQYMQTCLKNFLENPENLE
ncbi:hypothetical protein C0584_03750 [Candidatus Parcubacteria bacterium]|nr:MAG: hypothetical protein C0584_03750 [Candidatus Parcubacteria bacterium]